MKFDQKAIKVADPTATPQEREDNLLVVRLMESPFGAGLLSAYEEAKNLPADQRIMIPIESAGSILLGVPYEMTGGDFSWRKRDAAVLARFDEALAAVRITRDDFIGAFLSQPNPFTARSFFQDLIERTPRLITSQQLDGVSEYADAHRDGHRLGGAEKDR